MHHQNHIELPSRRIKSATDIMKKIEDLIGQTIVGYRYGEAPESGFSWNYAENRNEPGVSMAQVGYYREYNSFAISDAASNRKRYYYVGEIAGEGGDDEICLTNARRISYKDYLRLRKETKQVSNDYVNAICDRKLSWIYRGYDIGWSEEEIEAMRSKYIKK